jgi:uncharacterized membrane protein
MDLFEVFANLWQNHRGKIIGVIVGLIFAIFVIAVGFWWTIFIYICMAAGYFIGKRIDNKIDLKKSFDQLFRSKEL